MGNLMQYSGCHIAIQVLDFCGRIFVVADEYRCFNGLDHQTQVFPIIDKNVLPIICGLSILIGIGLWDGVNF